jgi:hypothetical protein
VELTLVLADVGAALQAQMAWQTFLEALVVAAKVMERLQQAALVCLSSATNTCLKGF